MNSGEEFGNSGVRYLFSEGILGTRYWEFWGHVTYLSRSTLGPGFFPVNPDVTFPLGNIEGQYIYISGHRILTGILSPELLNKERCPGHVILIEAHSPGSDR